MKSRRARPSPRWPTIVCLALVALVWVSFGRAAGYGFVEFDDPVYVYRNPQITSGINLASIAWAFTHSHALNWHPLTSVSHMLDWQLYGEDAAGHHVSNILLHTAAAVLLFWSWYELSSALWPSAFVAALFAVHPLRVESVVWISERKDVLSGVFFMLVLAAYAHYARNRFGVGRYFLVLITFLLGLLAKPMLVTVPFVLLLLDYWPLRRLELSPLAPTSNQLKLPNRGRRVLPLLVEKIPFIALSAGSCLVTLLARKSANCSVAELPLIWRVENALSAYVAYISNFLYPARLAVFYPHPYDAIGQFQVVLCTLLLAAVTIATIILRHRLPYLLVGWLWFVIMLVPVIGLVQQGVQARADRYTYLPEIGLAVMVAFGAADLLRAWAWRQLGFAVLGALVLGLLSLATFIQTRYWRDSLTLWNRALTVTSNNDTAHNNLGVALAERGQLDEAITHYQSALQLSSGKREHYNANAAFTHVNLGNALARRGEPGSAILQYHQALAICPDYADAHYNLGAVLIDSGESDQAISEYEQALALQPGNPEVETSLGNAFLQKHAERQAIEHYERALQADSNYVMAAGNLALMLATASDPELRDRQRALALALGANNLSKGMDPILLSTLATAQAANGNLIAALSAAQRALALAEAHGDGNLARTLRRKISRYRAEIGE